MKVFFTIRDDQGNEIVSGNRPIGLDDRIGFELVHDVENKIIGLYVEANGEKAVVPFPENWKKPKLLDADDAKWTPLDQFDDRIGFTLIDPTPPTLTDTEKQVAP